MSRRTSLTLSSLVAVGILVGGPAMAIAEKKDGDKPSIGASEKSTAADPALQAAYTRFQGQPVVMRPGTTQGAVVQCPPGQVSTGGSGFTSGSQAFLIQSDPLMPNDGNGWIVLATNTGTVNENLWPVGICTTP
jgi:hypothetical protein